MNRDRWQQIERMLDEALSRDRSEWPALLDAGCAGDAELRQEVMSLLGRVTAAERFLDAPPTSVAAALVASARGPGVDTRAIRIAQFAPHQIRARAVSGRTIASPGLHPNACANSGMFDNGPFTRNRPGECGSVASIIRAASGRRTMFRARA